MSILAVFLFFFNLLFAGLVMEVKADRTLHITLFPLLFLSLKNLHFIFFEELKIGLFL